MTAAPQRSYEAPRFGSVTVVEPDGKRRPLNPRLDLRNHSPTGLSWGYAGSGCAQLALAVLCDVFDDSAAVRLYQRFKLKVISAMPQDAPLHLTLQQVLNAATEIEAEEA